MKIRITWAVVILCLIFVVDFGRAIQKGSIIGKSKNYNHRFSPSEMSKNMCVCLRSTSLKLYPIID